MRITEIPESIRALAAECEGEIAPVFERIDRTARANTERVLDAFASRRVSDACFAGTTGYGYDDLGRETLDKIYADLFGAQSALVRMGFVNGTHAIASALFACLSPGDTLMSVMGAPYDTLRTAIGLQGDAFGSLRGYGVGYAQVDCAADGGADLAAIHRAVRETGPAAVLIQRSRGYADRRALTVAEIEKLIGVIKNAKSDAVVVVDNCYGEFVETREPTHVGADLCAGSLIKNPGGGVAPAGGYVAGRAELVERAAFRLTVPGIGGECGATPGGSRLLYQGLFLAPHTTAQALKTAVLCAAMLERLGYETSPGPMEERADIIQRARLGSGENMVRFCRGIQSGSPVDSFASPQPWRMPGYDCQVVMAAGAFVQGSSIELSADGPVREPYDVFIQGGLTYEAGRLGIMAAIAEISDK